MGSTAKEKFHLRWNDFDVNLSSAFRDLREQSDFFDVTLACDGDQQIDAHKMIIAACSPIFRNILKRNPHQNQLIYLKGVKFQDLVAILNFMYHGEVDVAEDQLNSFLAVAEELAVKGLTQAETTTTTTTTTTSKKTSKRQKMTKDFQKEEEEIVEVEDKRRRKSVKSDAIAFETSTTGEGDTCSPTDDEEAIQTAYAEFEGGYDDADYDGNASFGSSSSMTTLRVSGRESKGYRQGRGMSKDSSPSSCNNQNRSIYDHGFKMAAIHAASLEGNRAAARNLGINESLIRKWKKAFNIP